jgi:hypothetical protein
LWTPELGQVHGKAVTAAREERLNPTREAVHCLSRLACEASRWPPQKIDPGKLVQDHPGRPIVRCMRAVPTRRIACTRDARR